MKRSLVILVLGMILATLTAGPALAQRDPFKESNVGGGDASEPVPSQGGSLGQADPTAPIQTETNTTTTVGPGSADQLPATGPESSPWLVLAYVLFAIGAGTLTMVRMYRPAAT